MTKYLWLIFGGVGCASVVIVSLIIGMMIVNIFNTEISLKNRYEAQQNVVETSIDQMRKIIINQFKVSKEYADACIKAISAQSQGRSGGGLVKFVKESPVAGVSPEMYSKIQNSIDGEVKNFVRAQNTLTDIWNQHKTYCERIPNCILIGGKVLPKPEMISSTEAKEAIATKKMNDNIL